MPSLTLFHSLKPLHLHKNQIDSDRLHKLLKWGPKVQHAMPEFFDWKEIH